MRNVWTPRIETAAKDAIGDLASRRDLVTSKAVEVISSSAPAAPVGV